MSEARQQPADGGKGSSAHATDTMMVRLYDEVRQLAHDRLRRHRPGRGMQTTDVVHEVYLKLTRSGKNGWESRAHFFGSAARAMKQVLFDLAREQRVVFDRGIETSDLEGNDSEADSIGVALLIRLGEQEFTIDLQQLAANLMDLNVIDPRKADVVVCKFFAGMTDAAIATFLEVSQRTIERDWQYARAWLGQRMIRSAADS